MGNNEPLLLPLLPLPFDVVLLPGILFQIPVSGRADVVALFSAASNGRLGLSSKNFRLGCVPINSPLLRSDGQTLPSDTNQIYDPSLLAKDASQIDHRKLFMYGTVANIRIARGRREDGLSLIVEGISRFRIDRFVQMKPFFIAESTVLPDANGKHNWTMKLGEIPSDQPAWQ